jgi:hypothetical protein
MNLFVRRNKPKDMKMIKRDLLKKRRLLVNAKGFGIPSFSTHSSWQQKQKRFITTGSKRWGHGKVPNIGLNCVMRLSKSTHKKNLMKLMMNIR